LTTYIKEFYNDDDDYDDDEFVHKLPTVILSIIGIPSPTHSFTLGLNPSFSANHPYRSLSFFSFRIHYMDFPDCYF